MKSTTNYCNCLFLLCIHCSTESIRSDVKCRFEQRKKRNECSRHLTTPKRRNPFAIVTNSLARKLFQRLVFGWPFYFHKTLVIAEWQNNAAINLDWTGINDFCVCVCATLMEKSQSCVVGGKEVLTEIYWPLQWIQVCF